MTIINFRSRRPFIIVARQRYRRDSLRWSWQPEVIQEVNSSTKFLSRKTDDREIYWYSSTHTISATAL